MYLSISSPEPAFRLVSTKNADLWANPNEATFDWLIKAFLFHGPEAIFRREIEIWGNGVVYDSRHDFHESCEKKKKKENCYRCCDAVDNHRIYLYREKAKSVFRRNFNSA